MTCPVCSKPLPRPDIQDTCSRRCMILYRTERRSDTKEIVAKVNGLSLPGEKWAQIDDYPRYYVSSYGRVVSTMFNESNDVREMKTSSRGKTGYRRVKLWNKDGAKTLSVHRLVATAFIQNPESKPVVNHLDSNRGNNRVDNLEWTTHSGNVVHTLSNGRGRNTQIRFTASEAKTILKYWRTTTLVAHKPKRNKTLKLNELEKMFPGTKRSLLISIILKGDEYGKYFKDRS